jgi:hypothetical protein
MDWPGMTIRSRLVLSGGLGVLGGAALTGGALFLLRDLRAAPLVSGIGIWILLLFLLFFSLAEIPLMILGMRHMVKDASAGGLVVVTNAAFTLFAAIYALPVLLLTTQVAIGLALAALSLVRFAGALLFVPGAQANAAAPGASHSSDPNSISYSEEL